MRVGTYSGLDWLSDLSGLRLSKSFPQQHPVWLEILRSMGEDCRALVAFEEKRPVGWILWVLREGELGRVITSLPLIAYGGPCLTAENAAVGGELLAALRAKALELDVDVLTVGTSPFLTSDQELLYKRHLQPTHEFVNPLQVQSLRVHPLQALTSRARGVIGRQIKRAKNRGLRVENQLSPRRLDEWLQICRHRYRELAATPFPDEFYRAVHELGVPAELAEYWGVFDGDDLVGGTLFLKSPSVVDYFSPAFRSEYRQWAPSSLLLHKAFESFLQRGHEHFNWQASAGSKSVIEYKRRWGARSWRHLYLSALLNPASRLLEAGAERIKREYPHRFVLPFEPETLSPPR